MFNWYGGLRDTVEYSWNENKGKVKTLTATSGLSKTLITGEVTVVTVNEYLASRDAEMRELYNG